MCTVIACAFAGGFHSAAITSTGELFTWGGGEHGALGHGSTTNHCVPLRCEALLHATVVSIACGWSHTLIVSSEGEAWVCGNNEHGKGGTGDQQRSLVPRRIEVSACVSHVHTCAHVYLYPCVCV